MVGTRKWLVGFPPTTLTEHRTTVPPKDCERWQRAPRDRPSQAALSALASARWTHSIPGDDGGSSVRNKPKKPHTTSPKRSAVDLSG